MTWVRDKNVKRLRNQHHLIQGFKSKNVKKNDQRNSKIIYTYINGIFSTWASTVKHKDKMEILGLDMN